MIAAEKGHAKICYILAELGANVEAKNKLGYTALLFACKKGC